MEYLILFAALVCCGLLLFAKGLWDQRRIERWKAHRFQEEFGKRSERVYEGDELEAITRYFSRHQEEFFIDDITANDLDLDQIFQEMNTTSSSAGQDYLYYLLRTPSFSPEELARREELICFFTEEEKVRTDLQLLFWRMGRTRKYSLYDYMDFLEGLGKRSNLRHILADLLLLPVIGMIAEAAPVGFMCLFALLAFNIGSYLKEKRMIEPYLISFRYIFRSIAAAEKLSEMKVPELETEQARVRALLKRFQKLKRSGRFGMRVMGDGGNPLEIVVDYVNMVLHLDIIGFNVMLHELQLHTGDIDGLMTQMGRIEALIAVASYRQSLPTRCVPELTAQEGGRVRPLRMQGLYHPMLQEAVPNDIEAKRGVLLTGSNASGKSTFLKAVAINAIFAQTIHTCAAERYAGGYYRVLSSMSLRDDLGSGESYYIVEIKSIKRILDQAGSQGAPVLCFVDEVLRGTNTVERIAASTQILHSLCRPEVICFAATHDIELTELLEQEYDNYHFEEQVEEGDIFFPYRLMPGRAMTRNAIRLLAIMGYGEEIIDRAEALASHFLESGSWL